MKKAVLLVVTILLAHCLCQAQHTDDNDGRPKYIDLKAKRVVVPITTYENRPVVEVEINGKGPFSLFLDTAAGGTFLDQGLADELKLTSNGTMNVGDPANPNAIKAKRNNIDQLTIGEAVFRDVLSVSSDRSGIYKPGSPRGVIGISVFHDVLLTVDFPNKQLAIEKGSLPAPDGKRVLRMKAEVGGIYSVPISVNGSMMDAHVDTGSGAGISMPAELMDKLALSSKPVERGRGRTVGGEMVIYGANLAGELALGDYKSKDPEIMFFGRLRGANLGYGFLNRFAITLDQVNLRFSFAGPIEVAPTAPVVRDP